ERWPTSGSDRRVTRPIRSPLPHRWERSTLVLLPLIDESGGRDPDILGSGSANLEPVRSIFAAWERGDFTSAGWAHSDIERSMPDGPAPGAWEGLAGLAEGWREFLNAWQDFRAVAEEYRELDEERVLV